jgi:hypothetical protein
MEVAQSVQFACGLKATSFFSLIGIPEQGITFETPGICTVRVFTTRLLRSVSL